MSDSITTQSVITLTERAAEEIKSLLSRSDNTGKTFRVYVEKGGCSGMQYGLVFDEKREGDLMAENHGAIAVVDPFSAKYVQGAVVDFSDALTGGGFKISNPNAHRNCGCGKSFET